jgi:hypothetical protein
MTQNSEQEGLSGNTADFILEVRGLNLDRDT